MRRDRRYLQPVAQLVLVALLLGGLPMLAGVVLQPGAPAFTVNVCHPLQSGLEAASTPAAPRPPAPPLVATLPRCGAAVQEFALLRSRPGEPPEPPPPKSSADGA